MGQEIAKETEKESPVKNVVGIEYFPIDGAIDEVHCLRLLLIWEVLGHFGQRGDDSNFFLLSLVAELDVVHDYLVTDIIID